MYNYHYYIKPREKKTNKKISYLQSWLKMSTKK